MQTLAVLLHHLGLLLYAGPLVAFTILLSLADRSPGAAPWQADRLWRAWAPWSGLALGALILGGLLRYHGSFGGFSWGLDDTASRLFLAKHIVFLVLWVEYTYTEIWVAEPLRRLDPGPAAPADPTAYRAARARLVRHLWVGTLCALVILSISSFSA